MRVLIAADGSKSSDRAAKYVAGTLGKSVQDLRAALLYVDIPLSGKVSRLLDESAVERMQRDNAELAFKASRAILRKARVRFEELTTSGNAAQRIAEIARKGKFDLIVMGSQGCSALSRWLLGSVTSGVLATGRTPLLVVA